MGLGTRSLTAAVAELSHRLKSTDQTSPAEPSGREAELAQRRRDRARRDHDKRDHDRQDEEELKRRDVSDALLRENALNAALRERVRHGQLLSHVAATLNGMAD